jgi:hypothetical protein
MRSLNNLLCTLLLASAALTAADTPFAVVVSPETPIDNLTTADLRKLFLGDRQFWTQNLRVSLLVRAPVARERAVVVWTICKMTEAQFNQHWIGKVMRADCTGTPRQLTSNAAAITLVRSLPGAIAIINAAQVPEGLKVVAIDGKLPNQDGYKLAIPQ